MRKTTVMKICVGIKAYCPHMFRTLQVVQRHVCSLHS